jgi:iron(III) transport system permease protein
MRFRAESGGPAARDPNRVVLAWLGAAVAALLLLPWHAAPDLSWLQIARGLWSEPAAAAGAAQLTVFGKWWLWPAPLALLAAAFALRLAPGRAQGNLLLAAGSIAVAAIVLAGFRIRAGQAGMGAGALVVLGSLLMLAAVGLARRGAFRSDVFVAGAAVGCGALLVVFVAWPVLNALSAAFFAEGGGFSLGAFWERFGNERIWGLGCLAGRANCGVGWNTLVLALLSAFGTTVLGTMLALLSERGGARLRRPLRILALLPIITPPFVVGLGLILLFGRAGVVNQMLSAVFGVEPTRWFYGMQGILVAQLFAFTPIAFMIMRGVVQGVAPSLEEAALMLRADARRTFWSVTLPLLKPGLANAFLVGFIESIADFGNPIVVGGQYSVLSTEVFFAIVGAQYDQGRAASLAWVLMLFALGVFAAQRSLLGKRSFTTVGGKGDAGIPMALPTSVRRTIHLVALPWLAFTLVVYLFAFAGGLVRTWGRDYTPTLQHFRTAFSLEWGDFGLTWTGTAWNSLFKTVELAGIAAPITAALGLLIAWLLARAQFRGQSVFEFMALLAFAIPGTVLGVSYILAFNVPPLELTGTTVIIVLCFMFRNLPLGVRAGTAAFKQLDKSLDEASVMLRASSAETFRHIVLPLLKPAFVAALVYSFVRAMTTVSAVIFLVTAENELATTYIIGRVGQSDYGVALAYCTVLIVLMSAVTALIQFVVGERRLGRRAVAGPAVGIASPQGAT